MTNESTNSESQLIADYLARGGKLSSPDNPPPRYRAELLRLMSSFVDSELAGSAGFADAINWAPGIKERISASRIVLEKADHAERVLDLMSEFGTDKQRYNQAHHWAARYPRETRIDPQRLGSDMRLSVFHYPLEDWIDAVVMNVLMGLATVIHIEELGQCSYTPLAEVLQPILQRERRHMELGLEGLNWITDIDRGWRRACECVDYWYPRVAETFGPSRSHRFERLVSMGLRHTSNEDLHLTWQKTAKKELDRLKLT